MRRPWLTLLVLTLGVVVLVYGLGQLALSPAGKGYGGLFLLLSLPCLATGIVLVLLAARKLGRRS